MSESSAQGFTQRSLLKGIVLFIVTLGFYGLYWTHQLNKELKAETGADYSPVMRTVGLFIPIYNFYVMWKISKDLGQALDRGAGLLFALWLFLAPAWWIIVQSDINDRAASA